ncbi:serine/threonine-protein kinase [Vitiosangium sp. GDMCC 1.1324]|uniref:serine/threonine protein kinase n=1 Tax=Vitiosangium sp. (strain GDMCC 1.1324) TaxID=2138576 RepID=UPI00130DEE65|nr:serine/threonine-protein kinase [Vitiosangium sp. GDMCC 1.1324]
MTKPFHPALLQPGDMVRHYRVVRRLGNGGFAFVFQVEEGGRFYTLKMAARPPSDEDEAREDERAFREAVSLGHFRHPNLLAVRELGRWPDLEGGHFFFVTDYVPGSTFNAWRWGTQAALRRLVTVSSELAQVLAELHERGVCHRDIKADNVLVRDGDDKPFLIDFGAVFLPGAYTLTRELPPVTFHNMPPEVAAFLRGGEWEQGAHFPAQPAADLYAFGALLYEALTDCHPFNPRLSPEKLLLAIEFLPPVEPVQLDPRVPPGLNELVMRLLAKAPEQRPPSARAVHEELVRMLEREGDTEAWTALYAFPTTRDGAGPRAEAQPGEGAGTPEVLEAPRHPTASSRQATDDSPPSPERDAPVVSETVGPNSTGREARWYRKGWGRALVVLALFLLLLGIGWGFIRTLCASVLEGACSGAASTALAPPAPSEEGCEPLHFSTPRSFRETLALLCAVSTHFLACTGAPVRPDVGGFLERCPPEARLTALRLGFGKRLFTAVELTTVTDAGLGKTSLRNVRSGPMEGWIFLPDESIRRVTGEAKVLPDRVYVQFDRIYLDGLYPSTPGRMATPICAVVVSDLDRTKFGVLTHAALPDEGVEVDPSKVDRIPDAAVINAPMVDTYVQVPDRHFPE